MILSHSPQRSDSPEFPDLAWHSMSGIKVVVVHASYVFCRWGTSGLASSRALIESETYGSEAAVDLASIGPDGAWTKATQSLSETAVNGGAPCAGSQRVPDRTPLEGESDCRAYRINE